MVQKRGKVAKLAIYYEVCGQGLRTTEADNAKCVVGSAFVSMGNSAASARSAEVAVSASTNGAATIAKSV